MFLNIHKKHRILVGRFVIYLTKLFKVNKLDTKSIESEFYIQNRVILQKKKRIVLVYSQDYLCLVFIFLALQKWTKKIYENFHYS